MLAEERVMSGTSRMQDLVGPKIRLQTMLSAVCDLPLDFSFLPALHIPDSYSAVEML